MYIIAVYDVGQKRVGKMLKLCRRYLNWIQNSVFEGEITEVKLLELKQKAMLIMDEETDSLIIFKTRQEKWLDKEIVGHERQDLTNFLWFSEVVDDRISTKLFWKIGLEYEKKFFDILEINELRYIVELLKKMRFGSSTTF